MIRLLAVVALLGCSSSSQDKPETPSNVSNAAKPWITVADGAEHSDAIGLWRVPIGERRRESPGIVSSPGVTRFLYDGKHVTLYLFSEKEWMWRSKDEHYRLETNWDGNTLQYRAPFGGMSPLARFVNGRFETLDDKPPFRYEAVASRDACDKDDLVLLNDRPVHDYTIKPTDPH